MTASTQAQDGRLNGAQARVGASLSEPDVEALKAQVRSEVTARWAGEAGPPSTPAIDWAAIDASLERVEQLTRIGNGVPELPHFNRAIRPLARLLARVVLSFSRFLVNRQQVCNDALVVALHNLRAGVHRLERNQQEHVRRLEERLAHLSRESH